jgi:hypothetical protein
MPADGIATPPGDLGTSRWRLSENYTDLLRARKGVTEGSGPGRQRHVAQRVRNRPKPTWRSSTIFISTMSASVFHTGAGQYGLLTSIMAVGSIIGALVAARGAEPRIALLVAAAAIFGFGCGLAAIMPNGWLFGLALLIVGVSAQTFTISTNSLVQLSTEPVMRGRVMAILLATALGGAPSGRRSSVGSLIGSARVGRSASAPPRAWPRRWRGSVISQSAVICANRLWTPRLHSRQSG